MTDPRRWLDGGSDATSEERRLLLSGRAERVPSALRKRAWLAIAGTASVGTAAGLAGGAIPKGAAVKGVLSLGSSSIAKSVIAVAVLGTVGAGLVALRSPPVAIHDSRAGASAPIGTQEAPSTETNGPPTAVALAEGRVVSANQQPAARHRNAGSARHDSRVAPAAAALPAAAAAAASLSPTAASPVAASAPSVASQAAAVSAATANQEKDSNSAEHAPNLRASTRLREESARVLAIREKLLSGHGAEALSMLERARTDFPDGVLEQEREALTVRALAETGQAAAARKRGEAFLRAFPRSPHAAEVRALLGP